LEDRRGRAAWRESPPAPGHRLRRRDRARHRAAPGLPGVEARTVREPPEREVHPGRADRRRPARAVPRASPHDDRPARGAGTLLATVFVRTLSPLLPGRVFRTAHVERCDPSRARSGAYAEGPGGAMLSTVVEYEGMRKREATSPPRSGYPFSRLPRHEGGAHMPDDRCRL